MDLEAVRYLASPEGRDLLAELPPLMTHAGMDDDSLALTTRLRSEGHAPAHVAAVLTQRRLRARAHAKLGPLADELLFTPDGLEQASRIEVAQTHAERFASAGRTTVHDLGCGIGIDAVALAQRGVAVRAIDADPVTAAMAAANLAPWPDSRATVGRAEDFAADFDHEPTQRDVGVWLDPARRTPGVADARGHTRRTFRLEDLSPTWATVQSIAASVPATGAKLSPAFPHAQIPAGTEAQWTSWDGTVVECTLWWGPLAHRPGRTAQVLHHARPPVVVDESMADPDPPVASSLDDVGPWLLEPDRAVTTAGLVGAVTGPTGGVEVESGLGYVLTSSDRPVTDTVLPFARRYAVHDAFLFTVKSLRGWLRERKVTGLTIKKRGIPMDETRLRRELRVGTKVGDGAQATIILTRIAGRQVVLVVEAT